MLSNTNQPKYGYTTGSCARIGVRAALKKILLGVRSESERLTLKEDIVFDVPVLELQGEGQCASCYVKKYSGDDPDITNGTLIGVKVTVSPDALTGVFIHGGIGIGKVTKAGLDQPVGEYAINSGPRKMITKEAMDLAETAGFTGKIDIEIFAPEGEALAKKTFNPKLGILGGISILGTTGLLEPMSDRAVIETTRTHMNQVRALGYDKVIITPGNIGEDYAKNELGYSPEQIVQSSNYIGEALLNATTIGFSEILLLGHAGKLVKLAARMMNTHSMYGDGRKEIVAAYGALGGCSRAGIEGIMNSVSTDDMIRILKEEKNGCMEATFDRMGDEILSNMVYYIEKNTPVGTEKLPKLSLLMFSTDRTILTRKESL